MVLKMREKRKDSIMPHLTTILSGAAALLCMSPAAAQNAPATFRADPSVYKLLYEDQNIRVISATWARGLSHKSFIVHTINLLARVLMLHADSLRVPWTFSSA